MLNGSGNRDGRHFPNPDTLDVRLHIDRHQLEWVHTSTVRGFARVPIQLD